MQVPLVENQFRCFVTCNLMLARYLKGKSKLPFVPCKAVLQLSFFKHGTVVCPGKELEVQLTQLQVHFK